MKRCNSCGRTLSLDQFSKSGSTKDGVQTYCKSCNNERYRERPGPMREKYLVRRRADYQKNHDKIIEKSRAKYKAHPERSALASRKWLLKRRYGLTMERYDAMVKAQGGKCAICGGDPSGPLNGGVSLRLFVDHDHSCCTGKDSCGECVRGLLCSNCNLVLGQISDSLDWLIKAERYLTSGNVD
jgi:hypothetical protein